jgi:heme oxygenase (biliverdin-IX-beta and delta-forming)
LLRFDSASFGCDDILLRENVMAADDQGYGDHARRLMRTRDHAALATSLAGHPYVSLVATACEPDARPILLLSDLAQHTRNLLADPLVSLLFEDTGDHPDPLAGARLTLLGRAERCDDPRSAARFAARHPASTAYAGFADFHRYRVAIERGHLVAGFGRIAWIEAEHLGFRGGAPALAEAEAEIVAHMNDDHADAIALYAERLLGKQGAGWRMTGIDPEGIDLRREGETARLDFAANSHRPVLTMAAARRTLVALAEQARSTVPPA